MAASLLSERVLHSGDFGSCWYAGAKDRRT